MLIMRAILHVGQLHVQLIIVSHLHALYEVILTTGTRTVANLYQPISRSVIVNHTPIQECGILYTIGFFLGHTWVSGELWLYMSLVELVAFMRLQLQY